jgi:hypothetical protein
MVKFYKQNHWTIWHTLYTIFYDMYMTETDRRVVWIKHSKVINFFFIYITTILIFCYNRCQSLTQFCYTEFSLFFITHFREVCLRFKKNDSTYYQYFYMSVSWFSFWYYLFRILVFHVCTHCCYQRYIKTMNKNILFIK